MNAFARHAAIVSLIVGFGAARSALAGEHAGHDHAGHDHAKHEHGATSHGGHAHAKDAHLVEVGCAKCTYHMEGIEKCTVATRIGDQVMLLKDSGIDVHGLCKAPKMAKLYQPSVVAAKVVEMAEMDGVAAEIGCAKCSFHMAGVKSCKVAARIADKVMLVEGGGVDVHGLCGAPKAAKLSGAMKGDTLHASKIVVAE